MRLVGRTNDWPLVFFTVLIQASAGACLTRLVVQIAVGNEFSREAGGALLDPVLPVVLVLLVLGGAIGALHLGRLGPARFVLANLRSSALSREMAWGLLFGLLVTAHFVLARLDVGSWRVRDALGFAGVAAGVALVYQIPRIYRLRTVPAWDTWYTSAAFRVTPLVLGPAVVAATLAFVSGPTGATSELVDRILPWLGLASAIGVVLQLLVAFLRVRDRRPLLVRTVMAVLSAALLVVFTVWGRPSQHAEAITAAAILLLGSELLGRFRFYALHERVGL